MRQYKLVTTLITACALFAWACSSDDSGLSDAGNDAAPLDATADATADVTVDAPADVQQDTTVLDAPADVADGGSDAIDDTSADVSLDAGNDALPPEGTACTPPNDVQEQGCGYCGTQYRACLPDSDGGFVWGSWGYCQGEAVNGCDPNQTYPDTACGNCGTMKHVCLSNCTFDVTQTCTEPPNACNPGSTDFQLGLSCDGGGRERTCDNQCTFGNWGQCQDGPSIPTIQVPATVGATNSTVQTLDAQTTLPRVYSGTCPSTLSSTTTAYEYARVQNSTAQDATVDVYHSQSGLYIDTVMAIYPGSTPPADNDATARGNCSGYVDDGCYTTVSNPTSCSSSWAGEMVGDGHGVVIPAGGSVVVYSAAYYANKSGDFQINVRTEALQ